MRPSYSVRDHNTFQDNYVHERLLSFGEFAPQRQLDQAVPVGETNYLLRIVRIPSVFRRVGNLALASPRYASSLQPHLLQYKHNQIRWYSLCPTATAPQKKAKSSDLDTSYTHTHTTICTGLQTIIIFK
jgi:hypothetical protein